MKIRIVIPKEMWGEDLEITLQSEAHIECQIEEAVDSDEDEEISKSIKEILKAYRSIFTSRLFENFKRIDSEGRECATPGDVRKSLRMTNGEEFLPSTPRIGRVMKNKLLLLPGIRQSYGVPYYWDVNEEAVEEWMDWLAMN